jgi:membrane protease YdiL (CAAX protease family)
MSLDLWISLGVVIIVSTIVFITGYRKIPAVGIIAAALIIGIFIWYRKQGLDAIGFFMPKNWLATILWSIGLGIGLSFVSTLVVEPIIERSTGQPINLDIFEKIRGNWKQLLVMLVTAWILAAFLEEMIFRGYLMSEIGNIIGRTGVFASIALLISAIVFGFAHWYQGRSGALTAAIMGLILGDIFIWSGYNLWMPIITHMVIDTIGLLLVYSNNDIRLKNLLWKENKK